MRDPRFEPEAAGDGQVEVSALSVPYPLERKPCVLRVVTGKWRGVSAAGV